MARKKNGRNTAPKRCPARLAGRHCGKQAGHAGNHASPEAMQREKAHVLPYERVEAHALDGTSFVFVNHQGTDVLTFNADLDDLDWKAIKDLDDEDVVATETSYGEAVAFVRRFSLTNHAREPIAIPSRLFAYARKGLFYAG